MRRVSSQATNAADLKISAALKLISPKFPIGVPIIYNNATKYSILVFEAIKQVMMGYLQILFFVIFGVALIWFGFTLFIGQWEKIRTLNGGNRQDKYRKMLKDRIAPDDPQACPVCSVKLYKGELVKTHAFPSITGGKDRLMHVLGCAYCIDGDLERKCPVCGTIIQPGEFLIARIFERTHTRNHVHVLGCMHCRQRKSA